MTDALGPGSLLGVLGGGQLGAMFAVAARRLGYRIAVWDPDPEAPALRLADKPLCASFEDPTALRRFAAEVRGVTYEWENIPISVTESLEAQLRVRPASRILRVIQNRLDQKRFLADQGFPVAPFRPILRAEDLAAATDHVGFPALCKTATSGYDGKGQWRVMSAADLPALEQQLQQPGSVGPWILERYLSFQKELSIVVVRGHDGERRPYPVAENLHEAGILRLTHVPAGIDARTAEQVAVLAASVVEALEGIGVFCIELFLMPDSRLFINEIAPRPHNSGHYTLDACTVSQFEQQVRALASLPLGEVRMLSPAVMLNLLGEDVDRITEGSALADLLRVPGACLHLYGKRTARPRRKMGHVTWLSEKPEQAADSARAWLKRLATAGDRRSPWEH
jgi:5-(carboxyamino)imidazole ribonucleotide synthase